MKFKFLIVSLLLITVASFYEVFVIYSNSHKDLSQNYVQAPPDPPTPVRFIIKNLDIDLPIFETEIVDGVWEDSENGVSYLQGSPLPGDVGNSIMYGHNWANILGGLKNIKSGDQIEIVLSNGEVRIFNFRDMFDVTVDQTHILSESDYPKLTIYTCDSFLDAKRLVVTATPFNQ